MIAREDRFRLLATRALGSQRLAMRKIRVGELRIYLLQGPASRGGSFRPLASDALRSDSEPRVSL